MRQSNYDKAPETHVKGFDDHAWDGMSAITLKLQNHIDHDQQQRRIVALECYPGVVESEIVPSLCEALNPIHVLNVAELYLSQKEVEQKIARNLTEDRVRGIMTNFTMDEFWSHTAFESARETIDSISSGIVFIYGMGASQVTDYDCLIYADMARWEIQLRYRRGQVANWHAENFGEDFLRMYKRGYFVDWRIADRLKQRLFDSIDFLLDTNELGHPKMITGSAFRAGLKQTVQQPFRVVPYFDAAPWGGQWMQAVCDLDPEVPNFGWCFDGVPEENSLYLRYGTTRIEVPSINLVFYCPLELLGEKVHARFGKEFPIRFDFLDTMGGGNLSLQVHPTTEYIQEQFGMPYTQDESYYILDAGEEACVYLGLREGVSREEMLTDLQVAETGTKAFPAEKYVNRIPTKPHDHFMIPAGTIHCSGKNAMVLEISATPYIFTFKLWDWGRLGLDGLPRPIHLQHGAEVINWGWDTPQIEAQHVNPCETLRETPEYTEERTGLHEREFIETRRHWFTGTVPHHTEGNLNVLNLVQGEAALVESTSEAFAPFVVHYAETFIMPAQIGEYTIRPYPNASEQPHATIKAFVR